MANTHSTYLVGLGLAIAVSGIVLSFTLGQSDRSVILDNLEATSRLGALSTGSRVLHLELVALDPVRRIVSVAVSLNAPEGKSSILVPLNFIGSYLHMETIEFSERPSGELRFEEQPGTGWTQYRGRAEITFDAHFLRFPFDSIELAVAFDDSRSEPPAAGTEPTLIFLQNFLPDYTAVEMSPQVRGGNTYFFFRLRRNGFLIFLSVFLVLIAAGSAIVIVRRSSASAPQLSLLTYFVGLWAMRDIVMTPLKDYRPFPTILDLAVIALFCFTVMGVARPGNPTKDTDSSRSTEAGGA